MSNKKANEVKDLDKIRQEALREFDKTDLPTKLCIQAHAKWEKALESVEQRVRVIDSLVDKMDIYNRGRPQDIEAYVKCTSFYNELFSCLATTDALITMVVNRGVSNSLSLANVYASYLLGRKVD